MERRDKVFFVLLLGGLGYGGYQNREFIEQKLGLDDLAPGRIKAVDLCKHAFTLDRVRPNWVVLEGWLHDGQIEEDGELWTAQRVAGDDFRVLCRYKRDGEVQLHRFAVDTASGGVRVEEDAGPPR
ncbi:MAG: hypothetical protein R3F56_24115 [Planctomycetota bacterium]